jgi:GNAT superfamily N-acetyltransferase
MGVALAAMTAAYVDAYHIFTNEEMARYSEAKPSWEQGKEYHFFVACLDFHVLALADLTLLSDGWRLVEPMHVLPLYWRCGIGAMLWDRCVMTARTEGAPGLRVWSYSRNERANSFYASRGCRQVTTGTVTLGSHAEPVVGFECPLPP